MSIPHFTVCNSGKQGKMVHTLRFFRFSPSQKHGKSACWGPSPIPRQGLLALPCKRSTSGAAPSEAIEKAAGGGTFPGFGFQYPTSILQECIYSYPACHDCFRWNRDSRRAMACWFFVLWCLTLQNHAVTGCAGLFIEFEKTPIPCGFAGCSYETACRLMMPNLAILAIKISLHQHSSPDQFSQTWLLSIFWCAVPLIKIVPLNRAQ